VSGGAGKKYRDLASELDAWDRLCGEEEAAMQTGPGLTEVERKSRRKSHTPGGRNDVTRVSHIEINGAVAPCALGAQALFEIETWTGRAGGREGVGGGGGGGDGEGGGGRGLSSASSTIRSFSCYSSHNLSSQATSVTSAALRVESKAARRARAARSSSRDNASPAPGARESARGFEGMSSMSSSRSTLVPSFERHAAAESRKSAAAARHDDSAAGSRLGDPSIGQGCEGKLQNNAVERLKKVFVEQQQQQQYPVPEPNAGSLDSGRTSNLSSVSLDMSEEGNSLTPSVPSSTPPSDRAPHHAHPGPALAPLRVDVRGGQDQGREGRMRDGNGGGGERGEVVSGKQWGGGGKISDGNGLDESGEAMTGV
jgi:hypothetical protein